MLTNIGVCACVKWCFDLRVNEVCSSFFRGILSMDCLGCIFFDIYGCAFIIINFSFSFHYFIVFQMEEFTWKAVSFLIGHDLLLSIE